MKHCLKHCLKYKSCYKTISWRFVASSITFIINFSIFGSFGAAGVITILDQTAKTILYYANEQLWIRCEKKSIIDNNNDHDNDDNNSIEIV